jgi:hypothetical protein
VTHLTNQAVLKSHDFSDLEEGGEVGDDDFGSSDGTDLPKQLDGEEASDRSSCEPTFDAPELAAVRRGPLTAGPVLKTAPLFDDDDNDESGTETSGDHSESESDSGEQLNDGVHSHCSSSIGSTAEDTEFAGGNIVAAQARLSATIQRVQTESTAELKAQIDAQEIFDLPSIAELETERAGPPNLPLLKRRIEAIAGES